MSQLWINFIVVISIQLIMLVIHAWREKKLKQLPKILLLGCGIGVVFGIGFDLFVGHFLGLYSYLLGFTFPFLFWNGLLSYGFMQANVLLMQTAKIWHFYIWSVIVGLAYEITNYFYPVWSWEFSSGLLEYLIVVFVLYAGLSLLMALIWHVVLGHKFSFIRK